MSDRNLEDEYFKTLDAEATSRLKAEKAVKAAEEERQQRKETHYHKCGKCGTDMDTLTFRGVEIEQCGACGAVLLDPGELILLAGNDTTSTFQSFFSMFRPDSSDG